MTDTHVVHNVDLGYRPRAWQAEAHRKRKRFTVQVVHARAGKSVGGILTMIDQGLQCQRKMPQYAYIAPMLNQARRNSWGFIKHYTSPIPGVKVSEGDLTVTLPNGAKLMVLGADDPDALRGLYLDGVVIDEPAQMKPETWGEVIFPRLMDRCGWALFTGTPKGTNLLSQLYYAAVKQNDDPSGEWAGMLYTVYQTGVFDAAAIALMQRTMSEAQFRQEMMCDFSAQADNQLIPLDLVMAAQSRIVLAQDIAHSPRILGVDVAHSPTGDRSVIFPRQGLCCFKPQVWRGIDNMQLAAEVARTIDEWGADAVFVDRGAGHGVISRLDQLGYAVIGVDFGGKSGNPSYANKKTEMWHEGLAWIERGGSLPKSDELAMDLCIPTYSWRRADSVRILETKDDIKDRGLPSPDLGDAWALTFAYPVASRDGSLPGGRRQAVVSDSAYEPFKD